MQLLLDTNHLSILQERSEPGYSRLTSRLQMLPRGEIAASIVSFQEQVRGWLAWINKAQKPESLLRGYANLLGLLRDYNASVVLPYDTPAWHEFEKLRLLRLRIGTLDQRIAAIALARRLKLLTSNLRDFRHVPGLAVEDWTVP
mgnify:CR=1 FL=1